MPIGWRRSERGTCAEVRESGDVVHVDRLLDELDADVLEATQRIDGLEHRPPLVGVDSQGDVIGDLVFDRLRDPRSFSTRNRS